MISKAAAGETRHWRRPLKNGCGCEFYFRAPDGQTIKGSAASDRTCTFLQNTFERYAGCTLPDPEIKPMRGNPKDPSR